MLLWVLFGMISFAMGANILVVSPLPIYSHQLTILALTTSLHERGHNITILTTNPTKIQSENYTEIDLSFSYTARSSDSVKHFFQKKSCGTFPAAMATINMIADIQHHLSLMQYESPVVKHFIRSVSNEKFDLVIVEVMCLTSYLALGHILKAPVISVSTMSMWNFFGEHMGNPNYPAYVPSILLPYGDHMSLWERIQNLLTTSYISYVYNWKYLPNQEYHLRKNFGEDFPPLWKMESRISLQLICVSPLLSYPQPTVPGMIHVGALHIKDTKALPNKLNDWMNKAKEGVVYFSFGSNFQSTALPQAILEAFITAFSKFPNIHFVWKWESDSFSLGQPDNVRFMKWVSQQDLLAHPKVRGFITQGGIQSLQEAVHFGIPIIGVPMYLDQGFNIQKMVTVGAGVKLEFADLNKETIYSALNKIINDKSYKINMEKLSNLTKDEPQSPMEKAVWWVEYVLRNKGSPFRVASLDMPWYQYFLVDIAFCFVTTIILCVFIIVKIFTKIKSVICVNNSFCKVDKIE